MSELVINIKTLKFKGGAMKYRQTTNEPDFNGLPINIGTYGKLECYTDVLHHILNRFSIMTWKHNKTLFVRFDTHFPYGYTCVGCNQEISDFVKLFKEYYSRHRIDCHYIWVREQSATNKLPHYHFVTLFDGNKIQKYYPVVERAADIWSRVVSSNEAGLVNYCDKDYENKKVENGIMIRRPSSLATGEKLHEEQIKYEEDFNRCFRWASYLAKVNQKQNTPPSVRRFGSSKIPNNFFEDVLVMY